MLPIPRGIGGLSLLVFVDGKAGSSFAIWFDNLRVHVGYLDGPKVSSRKEAEDVINGSIDWSIHPILLGIKDLSSEFVDISFHILFS